jgi:redox-sensitive bicupin YhaK (pirin superfamily)
MRIDVRRAGDRFVTEAQGRTTRHSFSFDRHYDPANVGMGQLVCLNDDLVQPGAGYPEHPHRELEILTWVLEGELRHEDSAGRSGTVPPGVVQRLCAGTGIRHTEVNAGQGPVRFVQMWVRPGESGLAPAYHRAEVGAPEGWLTLASGMPAHRERAALPLSNAGAALHAVRLDPGATALLPQAPLLHLFVTRGIVDLEDAGPLGTGDEARLHDSGSRRLTGSGEVLLWEMTA